MKKIVACLLVAVMLFSLAACSGGKYRKVDDIQASGEIVMLTNAGFPPFEYVDGIEPMGVDVDIANEIAKDLGVSLKVVDMDFDGLIAEMNAGRGDFVAAGMSITEERKKSVDFTIEYVKSSQYMIVKKGSPIAVIDDLKGKKIGVQIGTTGDYLMTDAIELEDGALHNSGAEVKGYKTALEAAMDLNAGRLDAVVVDMHPANAIAAKNADLEVAPQAISDEEAYAIAVSKGNKTLLDAINATLTRLMSEGKIETFLIKHTTGE